MRTSTGPRSDWLHWLFALTLLPLVVSVFVGEDDVAQRIERTLEQVEDAATPTQEGELDEASFFSLLPEGRIEGAHLARDTWLHWIYGLVAAAGFFAVLQVLFRPGNAKTWQIVAVGVATATAGIALLLAIQAVASMADGGTLISRRIFVLAVFFILKFIGYSYRAALDPESGFLLSMLGFTFGVGLCEELVKALPIYFNFRSIGTKTLDWAGARMWGLASGIGFGVAEGIMYSSDFYNGISTGGIYLVRFVSCVGLHAIWGAAVAIMIFHRRQTLEGELDWGDLAAELLIVLSVPMVLHGLYDTLLKKDFEILALLTALGSFAWLALVTEWTRRTQAD